MSILFIIAGIMIVLILAALVVTLSIKFDEDHSAKEDAWHIKLYRFLGAEAEYANRPKSVCEYFWKYFIRIITIPFTLPSIILVWKFPNHCTVNEVGVRYAISLVFWILMGLSYALGNEIIPANLLSFKAILSIGLGLLMLSAGLGILFGIAYGIIEGGGYISNGVKKATTKSMLSTRIKSWKEKNCPRINWKL